MNPQEEIQKLRRELADFKAEFYKNNFASSQDFNKYCRFNSTLKVPHYASVPSSKNVGEIIEVGGKLYISTAVDTWTVVGTQS